jgi:hypothetical protein
MPKAKTLQNRQKGGLLAVLAPFGFWHVTKTKTEREVLDEVRQVFPNARFVRREPPLDLAAKECLVCGRVYYSRSGAESQYCGNKCASVGHRQDKNPRRTRIQSLRDRCRLSWQRAIDNSDAEPETFEGWLHRFEKRIGHLPEQVEGNNGNE